MGFDRLAALGYNTGSLNKKDERVEECRSERINQKFTADCVCMDSDSAWKLPTVVRCSSGAV
jgi:hypothetical protein